MIDSTYWRARFRHPALRSGKLTMSSIATLVTRSILLLSLAGWSSAAEQSRDNIKVLPVVDKQDIRIVPVTPGGETFERWIRGITQDDYGFLWFGTNSGLFRYDGYEIKPFPHDSQNPNTVSDDDIRTVFKDRAGVLWIGTNGKGLDSLDLSRGAFTHYRHKQSVETSLSGDTISCIYQDHSGTLWIGTNDGLDRLNASNGTFAHYKHNRQDPASLSSDGITALYEDSRGYLWVGTVAGLNKLDRTTGRSEHFPHGQTNRRNLPGEYVSAMVEGPPGTLWIASEGAWLSALDVKTGEFTHYSFHSEQPGSESMFGITSMLADSDGSLWLTTIESGVLKLDSGRREFSRYLGGQVNTIFADAEGETWIGTKAHGFMRFLRKSAAFVNYGKQEDSPKELLKDEVQSVWTDSQGLLWIGRANGLQKLDRKTGRIALYQHSAKNPYSISDGSIFAMAEDHSGRMWFGSYGGGLNEFDRKTERFRVYRHDPNNPASLSGDRILCMLLDHEGMLWLGLQGSGLDLYDPGTGKFRNYVHDPGGPRGGAADFVTSVFEDREGQLWVGAGGEIERFDRKSGRFTASPHDPHALPVSIHEDRTGTLWIGTTTGLDRLDPSGNVRKFTIRDGLPGPYVKSILEDRHGDLWLATRKGLSHFSPETERFSNYFESDGLPGNLFEVLGNEASQMGTGEMVFGSPNSVTVFDPDQVAPNAYAPPVVLTEMLLLNQPVDIGGKSPLEKPIWATNAVTLHPDQSIFTLEFAALSYAAPEKNRYRYRLLGLEKDWNEVDSRQRLATYTNLSPSKYTFQLQGSNNDGVWNPKITTLAITVLPPRWATWWFRSLTVLSIAAAVFVAYRARVRGLELARIRLETQVAERTRELEISKVAAERANKAKSSFLAHMSHELRTPLNSILGFSSIVREAPELSEKHREDLATVCRSGEHLLGLIDDVLDTAKIEAGRVTLNLAPFDLHALVSACVVMMRVRAFEKGLALFLQIDPGVPLFVRSDAGRLRQVLINLIGNAVKFTERGSVTVRVDAGPADSSGNILLILEVEDTGIGIAPEDQAQIFDVFVQAGQLSAQKGTGLGLSITQQFVHLMGGSIHVESSLGKGSLFRAELPVQQAEESAALTADGRGQVVGLAPGQPGYRILIVEDKKENWLLLRRLLEDAGFQVQVAEDGAQGIELFRAWQPHLIWMDIRLPVMGGLEASREIRALEGGRLVKIVALTASAFAQQREEVLAAGLDDFLRKPYRREEIFDCMSRHLGLQYVYKEGQRTRLAEPVATLRPEAISQLPETLRKELADALVRLDAGPIADAIGRVSQQDAQLGEGLSRLSSRFAYTEILNALMNSDVRVRKESA